MLQIIAVLHADKINICALYATTNEMTIQPRDTLRELQKTKTQFWYNSYVERAIELQYSRRKETVNGF
jgi:hypothetical protein